MSTESRPVYAGPAAFLPSLPPHLQSFSSNIVVWNVNRPNPRVVPCIEFSGLFPPHTRSLLLPIFSASMLMGSFPARFFGVCARMTNSYEFVSGIDLFFFSWFLLFDYSSRYLFFPLHLPPRLSFGSVSTRSSCLRSSIVSATTSLCVLFCGLFSHLDPCDPLVHCAPSGAPAMEIPATQR